MATLEKGNCVPVGSAVFHVRFFGEDVSKGTKQQKNDGKMGDEPASRFDLKKNGNEWECCRIFYQIPGIKHDCLFSPPQKIQMLKSIAIVGF
jgi:hypothetical protein